MQFTVTGALGKADWEHTEGAVRRCASVSASLLGHKQHVSSILAATSNCLPKWMDASVYPPARSAWQWFLMLQPPTLHRDLSVPPPSDGSNQYFKKLHSSDYQSNKVEFFMLIFHLNDFCDFSLYKFCPFGCCAICFIPTNLKHFFISGDDFIHFKIFLVKGESVYTSSLFIGLNWLLFFFSFWQDDQMVFIWPIDMRHL